MIAMRKMFFILSVIAVLTAPAVIAEAAETASTTTTVEETKESRTEDRLLREAKRLAREISKAQRLAKKAERTEVNAKIEDLRVRCETADREEKKELRAEIAALRENKSYDTMDEFLDNLILVYDDSTVTSGGYVVSVADIRKNLDAAVTYDKTTRTLTLTKDDITVKVTLDADGAYTEDGELIYKHGKKNSSADEEE